MNRSQSDSKAAPIDPGQTPGVMAEMDRDWFCRAGLIDPARRDDL